MLVKSDFTNASVFYTKTTFESLTKYRLTNKSNIIKNFKENISLFSYFGTI